MVLVLLIHCIPISHDQPARSMKLAYGWIDIDKHKYLVFIFVYPLKQSASSFDVNEIKIAPACIHVSVSGGGVEEILKHPPNKSSCNFFLIKKKITIQNLALKTMIHGLHSVCPIWKNILKSSLHILWFARSSILLSIILNAFSND